MTGSCPIHLLYSGQKEGGEGEALGERVWEGQPKVVSRVLVEVLALYR